MAHAVRREAGPLQREVEAVYAQYDPERCGFLTRRPYKLAFLALFGCKPSKCEVEAIFGQDKTGRISRQDFVALMLNKSRLWDQQDTSRKVFAAFDREGKGFLTLQDVLWAFQQVAPSISPATVQEVFSEFDSWGDGRIRYADFDRMMATTT
eukprot:EG_transcript_29908